MKTRIHIFLFVLMASVAAISRVSAQCPSTTPDFPSIGWSYGGCINIMINECTVTVCYCYRTIIVGGASVRFDYTITSIDLNGDDDCVWQYLVDWDDLIAELGKRLVTLDPQNLGPCPPCPERDFRFNFWATECWQWAQPGPPVSIHWSEILILNASVESQCEESWCGQGFAICCNPTTGEPEVLLNGARVHIGEADCDAIPENGYVTSNTCYSFNPCEEE